MALVAKRNRIMALKNSQQGQISIFFSASLVVFISVIAFVINVGLFVKAKINLQNATDASAFAGAAVQARQLTKIGYLNWEMRNIYKEWMYKYYVVGSLNVPMVETTGSGNACGGGKTCMDFRLAADNDALSGRVTADPYNFPAVCIHIAGSKTNICKRYAVPGLPEFGGYNIPGTEEASRSFVDVLIGEKVNNCVERSKINMLVATTWAFNVLSNDIGDTLTGRGPAILSDRQGAWPRAIELAMRIRNLEKVMNRAAIDKPVCIGGIGECTAIDQFSQENFLGNERIVKAFYSGYRNLGNESDNEMKNSFTLQELPPTKTEPPPESSNSSLLIPARERYAKQFVDLKLMMVNYATFYAALIPRSEKDKSGACDISKVALPVPGYPLGFYKNPDVMTYYAVKGEAEFTGMFNPFAADTIKLTAYAAAKPAGGRVGPMLFKQKPSETSIRSRTDTGKFRSVPYIASLDVIGTFNPFLDDNKVDAGEYGPGVPLPINIGTSPFWLTDADSPIGGLAQGEPVQFGMPNLVYDFIGGNMDSDAYTDGGSSLFVVKPSASTPPSDFIGDKAVGLFNHDQFVAFKGDIGGEVTPEQLADQISRVKAATQYDAANYLIPTPFEFNIRGDINADSFGMVGGAGTPVSTVDGLMRYQVDVYAPLYRGANSQLDILYTDSNDVLKTIVDFMREQKPGMVNYIHSLNKAALQTYATSKTASEAAIGAQALFEKAAKGISDIDVKNTTANYHATVFPKSCDSLAGQFWHFYYGVSELYIDEIEERSNCPVTLYKLLQTYFAKAVSDPEYSPLHYKMEYNHYRNNWAGKPLKIFSAYMPGPYNGIGANGTFAAPNGFPVVQEVMRRNFYSTKLVTLDSLRQGKAYDENISNFAIYSEGNLTTSQGTPDRKQDTFLNPLDAQSVGADISSIKY
jgi:hypothetical protein